jgi:hypothetical protein
MKASSHSLNRGTRLTRSPYIQLVMSCITIAVIGSGKCAGEFLAARQYSYMLLNVLNQS